MRIIKIFEDYLKEGVVRKITPDYQRAENLNEQANRKLKLLDKNMQKLGINDDNSNDYIEYCYNILMFKIRSVMLNQGYSSLGQGAHEAEVAFARTLGFTEKEIDLLDQLRYFRNGILYYGKSFDGEYAKKIINFTKKKLKQ